MDRRTVIVGCGYVGTALAESLRADPIDPTASLLVTTRSAESRNRLRTRGFEAIALDVCDRAALRRALESASAVVVSVAAGRGGDYREVYVDGLRGVVTALDPATRPLVLYTSSSGIYAEDDGGWVNEDSALDRESERGRALSDAETTLLEAGHAERCRAGVLRLSGIVGPGRGPQRMLAALAGCERSDGDSWLNLVLVTDIVGALRAALVRRFEGVVNVSSVRPLRRREFYDALLARSGMDPIRWVGEGRVTGRRVAVDRLRERLGVEPAVVEPGSFPLT